MKWYWLLAVCFVVVSTDDQVPELPLAQKCNVEECKLPDCRCSSSNTPGGLSPRDTPQFVLLTFDDAINIRNIDTYKRLLNNRVNSKGCAIGATFYVSHEYTNYQLVNQLYNKGFEIALHSISHQTPQPYWKNATSEIIQQEIGDQVEQMSYFANIPKSAIKGVRMPFLQMTGNATFDVMRKNGLEYDCSWPTIKYKNPGLWPYTLDYASTQDCVVPPCPTASIPKTWVLPMIPWNDLNGNPCSMVDTCYDVPNLEDADAWFNFITSNFELHYFGSRSPFGFYVHEWYLAAYPAVEAGLSMFIDVINKIPDAFMVNSQEVINWVKNPIPIDEYKSSPCQTFTPTTCNPSPSCGPLSSSHTQMSYWMQICNSCPNVYPWLGNPLGQ